MSDPAEAQRKAYAYLGKTAKLYRAAPPKKFKVKDPNGRWVSFGRRGYDDFTKHKDRKRRARYLARATRIRGNWKSNPYSPNNLSIHILW